jgi:hypothetical protein
MNDEFYDLLKDEKNMDLLDEILDCIETGVEDVVEVEALSQKVDILEEHGEDVLVERIRNQLDVL